MKKACIDGPQAIYSPEVHERKEPAMSEKVVILCDPGIDGAFAVALALHDPNLEVLALLATAGNVPAEQATRNVRTLIDQMDPPRWPRLGEAPAVTYDTDGTNLHGPNGLGGVIFPSVELHHLSPSDKLLVELVKQHPHEINLICLGPLTVVSRAFDLFPEMPQLVKRIVCIGGTHHEPGNAGPVTEFHFACDPKAARHVLRCGAPLILVPLDMLRRVLFSPSDLLNLPTDGTSTCRFLRQIVPFGIAATSNLYGIEGFHLKDVLGVIAVSLPSALQTRHMRVEVETQGHFTKGMSVFDQRDWIAGPPNVEVVHDLTPMEVRQYIAKTLQLI
jgi:inosine-uridine nucleoside N-ribohydrolase